MSKIEFRALAYEADALAPAVSAETLAFHHGKHLKGYVDNLNAAIEGTPYENLSLEEIVRTSEEGIFNNAAQVLNHDLYFSQFRPSAPGNAPSGALAAAIGRDFGSFDEFKKRFSAASLGIFGSGWAFLSADGEGKLAISTVQGTGNPVQQSLVPLLTFDVWEHAYYIDWRNRRADYIASLWDIVDWDVVARRYKAVPAAVVSTDFDLPGTKGRYVGKVRDVYDLEDGRLVMVVTDRISAFDVVLPKGIPYKGQILNMIASKFLDACTDILPVWKTAVPDPNVTVGLRCEPFKVEMVIRGYLSGHAWREYKAGKRTICGVPMPDGMVENQKFPEPIITPTTKAAAGHDEDISREEIIASGLVSAEDYSLLEKYTRAIFARGTEMAANRGLILVDTKYEFGKKDGKIYLMDEVHTPDSSRYFYADGYAERLAAGERQRQLSKEFVREWLMENGFQGREGEKVPEMTPEVVAGITDRYVELYEKITGEPFVRTPYSSASIEDAVKSYLDE